MPNYQFKCQICLIETEMSKSINDETMPKCCGLDMNQVYYAPATQFKGKGWGGQ